MPLLLAGRLWAGDVFNAPDWYPWTISYGLAGFHGVPGIYKTLPGNRRPAPALDTLPPFLVRRRRGAMGAGRCAIGLWLSRFPLAHQSRLFLDSHPGADLRGLPHVFPQ